MSNGNENSHGCIGFIFLSLIFIICALTLFLVKSCVDFRHAAVARGYAHYNSETGAWEWLPPPQEGVNDTEGEAAQGDRADPGLDVRSRDSEKPAEVIRR